MQVQSLDWEDRLEEGMATHFSILAWRVPWTEKPGGLQSMGSQRVRHDGSNLEAAPRECSGWFDLLSRPLKLTPYQQ